MKDLFETPVTYRIEKTTIWGESYIGKTYYSPGRAVQALKLMNLSKLGDPDKWYLSLVHLRGDQVITRQRLNLKLGTNECNN